MVAEAAEVARAALDPCAGVPRQARRHAADPVLRIGGLVGRPLALRPADLAGLRRVPFLGALSCVQNGNVPETDWTGIPLADLVALADPLPEARFVRVCAGPYAVPAALADAGGLLVCDRIADEPLTVEQGAPWRLVVPGQRYFTSVKWVDRIELAAEPPDNSAERLANARNRARAVHEGRPWLGIDPLPDADPEGENAGGD